MAARPNIHILGIQGSGKGTQSALLTDRYGLTYLSTGNMFRERAKADDELGRTLAEQLRQGLLMSDDLLVESVDDYLTHAAPKVGLLADGVLRTLAQYRRLASVWEAHGLDVPTMVHLDLAESVALARLEHRREQSADLPAHLQRTDDTPEAIERRFSQYRQLTQPVVAEFARIGRCITIDADRDVETVNRHINQALEAAYPSLAHGAH